LWDLQKKKEEKKKKDEGQKKKKTVTFQTEKEIKHWYIKGRTN